MVSVMVTVMPQVFFFDNDWPQVFCLLPKRRENRRSRCGQVGNKSSSNVSLIQIGNGAQHQSK